MQSCTFFAVLFAGILIAFPHTVLSTSDEKRCNDCKAFMADVSQMLQNETNQVPGSVCSGVAFRQKKEQMTVTEHHQLNKPPVRDNGNSCTDCVTFLGDLSDMLHNKTNQKIISYKIHQIFDLLGIQCSDFKIDLALIWLQNLVPDDICTTITFCPKNSKSQTFRREEFLYEKKYFE